MSVLAMSSGEDYPEAAKKHFVDAQKLLEQQRFDGAAYHAGYVAECIFRSLLLVLWLEDQIRPQKLKGTAKSAEIQKLLRRANDKSGVFSDSGLHDLERLREQVDVKCKANSRIKERWYALGPKDNWVLYKWRVAFRYKKEGAIPENEAKQYVTEAAKLYKNIWDELANDGALNGYI